MRKLDTKVGGFSVLLFQEEKKGLDDMRLYRIISLETFIDILHNKRERFVRPSNWEDTFEGYLYSKLYDKEERKKIVRDIYFNVCPRNYKATIDNILKLEHAKWFVYGQCWSRIAESDAMWRIYSYNNHSIQIQTTDVRIDKFLKRDTNIEYNIKPVKYDINPEEDITHMQVEQLKNSLSIYEPFLHKRKAFKHESETRILIDDKRWYSQLSLSIMGATRKIHESLYELTDEERLEEIDKRLEQYMDNFIIEKLPQSYLASVENLGEYISGVKVNPFAEQWYVDLVEGLCKEYGLKFIGQSELYKKINT